MPFDGQAHNLTTLLSQLLVKAKRCCWGVLTFHTGSGTSISLLTEHGRMPDSAIERQHQYFVDYTTGGTPIPDNDIAKRVIDAKMLHECLENSLTEK